jgi:hypothetical protein
MKYEYKLHSLESWLKENKKLRITLQDDHVNQEYMGTLELLDQAFQILPKNEIDSWMDSRTKKEKRLIPYLYKEELDTHVQSKLLNFIDHHIENDKRLFRVVVDVLYQSADTNNLWPLVQKAHSVNIERIARRIDGDQARKWKEFTSEENPIAYLAEEGLNSELGLLEELKNFYLTENLPLFKYVLLDVLKIADEDFYVKEKKLYKKFFVESSSVEQQQMADSLIKKCKLNHVKPLGTLIYDKLKTYRRKPMLWKHVGEEEKRRFASWILTLELKEFFSQVNKSHERFQYWKKFIVKLEDAVVIDRKKTLILYFQDFVIMEVLGTGAVYIYEIGVFNRHFQHKVDKLLEDREKPRPAWEREPDLRRDDVRNQDLIYKHGRLIHSGGWQKDFDNWLNRHLGWEVDADVLQKEAERDEGNFETL